VVGIDPAEDVALIQLTGASGLTTIKPDTRQKNTFAVELLRSSRPPPFAAT
jgi:hypothetical protein